MSKIVFTGGGSSGHVTPNLAIIEKAYLENVEVSYIGSTGIEKELIQNAGISFYEISSGKLRRHLSWQNFVDPFKVFLGIFQAYQILGKIKPKAIFSKGGFVSVPVVIAGFIRGIPVILHESDYTPGLANKISFPFAKKICVNFSDTSNFISAKEKIVVTGSPIREGLFSGKSEAGLKILGFNNEKPIILIMGGGLGSQRINHLILEILPELLKKFQVIHLCGKTGIAQCQSHSYQGYRPFAYLHDEFYDIMAAADIVVSRAGANSVFELLALKKPNLLIPLSKKASRGDQIDNAKFAHKNGFSKVIQEEELNNLNFLDAIQDLYLNKKIYLTRLGEFEHKDAVPKIWNLLTAYFA